MTAAQQGPLPLYAEVALAHIRLHQAPYGVGREGLIRHFQRSAPSAHGSPAAMAEAGIAELLARGLIAESGRVYRLAEPERKPRRLLVAADPARLSQLEERLLQALRQGRGVPVQPRLVQAVWHDRPLPTLAGVQSLINSLRRKLALSQPHLRVVHVGRGEAGGWRLVAQGERLEPEALEPPRVLRWRGRSVRLTPLQALVYRVLRANHPLPVLGPQLVSEVNREWGWAVTLKSLSVQLWQIRQLDPDILPQRRGLWGRGWVLAEDAPAHLEHE